mmetsp:Transcript_4404/g.5091  ORF Transcript_4404/g.5091 Transcript_4404/m.5091 type:complete len:212 (+) Transcript_4404:76-711(+)
MNMTTSIRKQQSSLFLLLLLIVSTTNSFIFTPIREGLKSKLLDLSNKTNRGLTASTEDKKEIQSLFAELERYNPIRKPLLSDKVNGRWSLEYTTSDVILGRGGYPRIGPIVQAIDTKTLTALNSEVVNYFNILPLTRTVTAELSPQSDQLTNVQFKRFTLGPIGFDAPEQFKGFLDVTYLDDDVRLTRGDKGNIFILTRMEDDDDDDVNED